MADEEAPPLSSSCWSSSGWGWMSNSSVSSSPPSPLEDICARNCCVWGLCDRVHLLLLRPPTADVCDNSAGAEERRRRREMQGRRCRGQDQGQEEKEKEGKPAFPLTFTRFSIHPNTFQIENKIPKKEKKENRGRPEKEDLPRRGRTRELSINGSSGAKGRERCRVPIAATTDAAFDYGVPPPPRSHRPRLPPVPHLLPSPLLAVRPPLVCKMP